MVHLKNRRIAKISKDSHAFIIPKPLMDSGVFNKDKSYDLNPKESKDNKEGDSK